MILNLISNTSTATGLTFQARLDTKDYPLGVKISKVIFDPLSIKPKPFPGDWNYAIFPR